jgi:hypothetical protein
MSSTERTSVVIPGQQSLSLFLPDSGIAAGPGGSARRLSVTASALTLLAPHCLPAHADASDGKR